MQIRLCDPSRWSGPHLERSERLLDRPKPHSKKGKATWTWRKNADFCLANGVRPAVGAFIQESLAQIDSVDGLAVPPSPEAKKSGLEVLKSRVSLLISFSHAILRKSDLRANHAKDWRNGAWIAHAIINDLVHTGLQPVHATALMITYGPSRPYHYRYMTETSRSYWVQQLTGLHAPLDYDDERNHVCFAKLLADLDKSLQIKDVHTALGYRFQCTTCFPGSSSTNDATIIFGPRQTTSTTCDPLLRAQNNACRSPQAVLLSPTGTGSSVADPAHGNLDSRPTAVLLTDEYGTGCPNLSLQATQGWSGAQTSLATTTTHQMESRLCRNCVSFTSMDCPLIASSSPASQETMLDVRTETGSPNVIDITGAALSSCQLGEITATSTSQDELRVMDTVRRPSDGIRELWWQPINSLRTMVDTDTHAQNDWLQTFSHVDEIDPSLIPDSVLKGWDTREPDNRLNSFFQPRLSTRTTNVLDMHSVTTACGTRFPYASQQVFSRVCVELPYESAIFSLVQCGDIDGTRALLTSGKTSLDAVDPYGLGLLYYASYYCWRGYGPVVSYNMCKALIDMSVNVTWCDEIGNTPEETMLDNILCARAMGHHSSRDMMSAVADIALLFKSDAKCLWTKYVANREFTDVHDFLLKLNDDDIGLSDSLRSLNANGELPSIIDRPDRQGRSPLAWAVEYGWADAARIQIEFGADPNQLRHSIKGASPLLHLAVAGPNLGRSREVVKSLIRAGADINAKDHEQWTAVHVVASWGSGDIMADLVKEHPDLSAVTNTGHSALDLAIDAGADDLMVALLRNPAYYGK